MGMAVFGAEVFLAGCQQEPTVSALFTEADLALMDEIGETILPDSDRSPGAKAAGIGRFMETIVTDCYSESEQALFRSGLLDITQRSHRQYGKDSMNITEGQRFALLSALDKETRAAAANETPHAYTMIKQLTIWGYFTSETGQTKALRYDPNPGGFRGNVDYTPGDRAWVGPLSSID